MKFLEIIFQSYSKIALGLLNFLLVFVLLNSICWVCLKLGFVKSSNNLVQSRYDIDFSKLYPGMSDSEIKQLLDETWGRTFFYDSFTQFKERPISGKFVHVDEKGLRLSKDQGPWPINKDQFHNIFVFGGSTTFSYGLSDEETVPSYLQEVLNIDNSGKEFKIYNFGRGHYFSTQERVFFEKMLLEGFIPDSVVFIDGLNDFINIEGEPVLTKQLTDIVAGVGDGPKRHLLGPFKHLSFVRVIHSLVDSTKKEAVLRPARDPQVAFDPLKLQGVIDRYVSNKKMIEAISARYGIRSVFVWQPVPTYSNDIKKHLFYNGHSLGETQYTGVGFKLMRDYLDAHPAGDNFIWCTDLHSKDPQELYVDMVHYTAKMAKRLATCIKEGMSLNLKSSSFQS